MTARPWRCPACDTGIPANHVTSDQRHDQAQGGCGGLVVLCRPDPTGPVAYGVFAQHGEDWVFQHPSHASLQAAKESAASFVPGTVLEIRQLFDGVSVAVAPDIDTAGSPARKYTREQAAQAIAHLFNTNRTIPGAALDDMRAVLAAALWTSK